MEQYIENNDNDKDSVYIVMPAYNEEENIEEVVRAWHRVVMEIGNGSRIIVADSGSVDKTHEILQGLKNELNDIEILCNTEKQHGPKVIALYNYAIQNNVKYVFQTDSDGQTDPQEFFFFWDNREKYDAIIGKREKRGDGKSRAFVEKVVCFLLRIYFDVRVPDANAPFRLIKTSVLNKYLSILPLDYNLPNIMLTTFFMYYNENVMFKSITFKPRQGGVNSINIKKIIGIGWKALSDFRMFKKYMRVKNNE